MRRNLHSFRGARGRLLGGAAALAIATVALAGCASGGSTKPSASSSAGPVKSVSLEVGIPSPSVSQADFYYALHTGIFTDIGLDLTVTSPGSVLASQVAAGQVVIGQYGSTGMFAGQLAGHDQSIVVAEASGNNSGEIVVAANSPVKKIMDLSGKTVGVVGASGSSFGAAKAYSNYIVKHGGKELTVVSQKDIPTLTAATSSGQIDAAIFTASFGAAIQAGQLKEIVKANSSFAKEVQGTDYPATSYFGLKDQLSQNHDAIVRLIAGIRIGRIEVDSKSDSAIAKVMSEDTAFSPTVIKTPDLAAQIPYARPFWSKDQGYISSDAWKSAITAFSAWGLNTGSNAIDVNSPKLSYKNAIDMSYWNDATPIVDKYLAAHDIKPTATPTTK